MADCHGKQNCEMCRRQYSYKNGDSKFEYVNSDLSENGSSVSNVEGEGELANILHGVESLRG
jgi:hypothetical protein